MQTLVIALVVAALAAVAASTLRRRTPEPPTQTTWTVPQQLDRSEFAEPDAPWVVVLFTSETCSACATMTAKAELMRSPVVSVDVVPFLARKATHERYRIDAVPTTVMADSDGVVRASFVGPVSATDLWAAMAELREPGSTPPPEAHTHQPH
jgi:hypothetical protein